jgi:hypothetical protein
MLFARIRYRGTNFTLNKEGWDSDLNSPMTSGVPVPLYFICTLMMRPLW